MFKRGQAKWESKLLYVIWTLLITPAIYAQCPTNLPNISDYGTGAFRLKRVGSSCLPRTISVTNSTTGATNIKTIFDYQGGPIKPENITTDSIHTYTRPGEYTIVQFSEKDGRQLVACPRIIISDTIPPNVRLIPCGNSNVNVVFDSKQDYAYDSYWISWGDGNIQEILPYIKSVSHTYQTPTMKVISVWGVQTPGYCKSQNAVLNFTPGQSILQPKIISFIVKQETNGELLINNPLKAELLLYSKKNNDPWESTGRIVSSENETIKVVVDSQSTFCFKLQATDSCLSETYNSKIICSGNIALIKLEKSTELQWFANGGTTDSRITLMKDGMSWLDLTNRGTDGIVIDTNLVCGREHCYQLKIAYSNGNFDSDIQCRTTPNTLCGPNSPVFIPDAFSPNGDGINDYLEIKGEISAHYDLSIYNNWGTMVFHTSDSNATWDGKYSNVPLPTGSYPYKLKLIDAATNTTFIKTGTIILLK